MRKFILFFSFLISAFCLLFSVLCPLANANSLAVTNGALGAQDATANTEVIQFDISWANSWRNDPSTGVPNNYDAAWVFVKYSTDSGATWAHATLKTSGTNPTDTNIGSGTVIDIIVPTDKKGAFIQRRAIGTGTLTTTGLQLTWDYGADGVTDDQASQPLTTLVRVMAIEMVYIPTASFDLGDGNGASESTNAFHVTNNTKVTLGTSLVGSIWVDVNGYDDNQIESPGIGIDGDGGLDTDNNGSVDNASFPTGYSAFYMMKYEISQAQWVDFFNTLTAAQKTTRDITSATGKNSDSEAWRNTVSWSSGNASVGANQYVACNFLSWADLAAYADWAALRPMTELEFEKAARGTTAAVNGEYAWGSTSLTAVTGFSNGGASNEVATPSGANGNLGSYSSPLRCGFAATASTTRAQAGASYYGIMELSGNLSERAVTVGNATGRAFTGTHGDGTLTTTTNYEGNATNTDWPGIDATQARGVTGATGSGFRGSGWATPYSGLTSNRTDGANTDATRYSNFSIRCVRTA